MNMPLPHDALGRTFRKLRISLTSRCNMACGYCVTGKEMAQPAEQLTGPEVILNYVASLLHHLPLQEVRLTGGEPLIYSHVETLVAGLVRLGIHRIGMTSNGVLLAPRAVALRSAGLRSVNVSLDAVDEKVFKTISPTGSLTRIMAGIDAALEAGLKVKLNSVIQKGVNESQVVPLFQWAAGRGVDIRFLEIMRMGHLHHDDIQRHLVPVETMLYLLSTATVLKERPRESGATARYWSTDAGIEVGMIANESEPFCGDCDRLRLDASGKLFGCISSAEGLVPDYSRPESVRRYLEKALAQKQPVRFAGSPVAMIAMGG